MLPASPQQLSHHRDRQRAGPGARLRKRARAGRHRIRQVRPLDYRLSARPIFRCHTWRCLSAAAIRCTARIPMTRTIGMHLGNQALRGERGTLLKGADALVRASCNPFFPYMGANRRDVGRSERHVFPAGPGFGLRTASRRPRRLSLSFLSGPRSDPARCRFFFTSRSVIEPSSERAKALTKALRRMLEWSRTGWSAGPRWCR